jgi:FKBP-type peptidyl-prolyl cis-trans isomerase FkpA
MLKIKNFLMVALAGTAIMQACNDKDGVGEVQTTESGLQYKYLRKGEEQAPDSGKVLTVHMMYSTGNDSVLFDSRSQNMPLGVPVNDPNMKGMLAEGFQMLHKGDSVEFIVPAKDFFFQTARMPVPAGIGEDSDLTFRVGVADVVGEEEFREIQMEQYRKQQEAGLKQQEEQLGTDVAAIEAYLKENNITAQKAESGLYYTVKEEGNGQEIDAGDEVTVHYRGTLLDGTPFDASYDRGEPFTFTVGQGMVIRGWDEALQLLRGGSKATLYIPSPLGYGTRSAGEVIKPNSNLMFDVEVVSVNKNKQQ